MAAKKNGDFVTALSFLSAPSTSGNIEAATVISEILSVSTPTNIMATSYSINGLLRQTKSRQQPFFITYSQNRKMINSS